MLARAQASNASARAGRLAAFGFAALVSSTALVWAQQGGGSEPPQKQLRREQQFPPEREDGYLPPPGERAVHRDAAEHLEKHLKNLAETLSKEAGPVAEVFGEPHHPYTRGLLESVPAGTPKGQELPSIGGAPPELHAVPRACVYQDRCPLVRERCRAERPEVRSDATGRRVACHYAEELGGVFA